MRFGAAWSSRRARRVAELGLAAAALTALGLAVYGSHLADGGLYVDDRWFYSFYDYAPGYLAGVGDIMDSGEFGFRPLQATSMAASYEVFGLDPGPLLALALGYAVLAAACFYALLRSLRLEPVHAGAIAALALISPAASSTKLWAAAGHNNLAIAMYFAGAALALGALDAAATRARLLHGVSLVLYAASLLLYEVAAVPILASVLLYRLRVPWRPAARRWVLDVAVVGAVLGAHALFTDRSTIPLSEQLDVAAEFVSDAISLVLAGGIPHGARDVFVPLFLFALGAGLSALVWPGWRADPRLRAEVERWAIAAGAAAVAIAAAYLIFVPAGYLRPLGVGIDNRTNILAGYAIVAFLYAVAMLSGTLALRFAERWRELATAFALAVSVALGIAYLERLGDERSAWAEAASVHEAELGRLSSALPDPAPGDVIYSLGNRASVGPGLPGLYWWDLYGAGRIAYGPSVRAILVPEGTEWICEPDRVYPDLGYALGNRAYDVGGSFGEASVVNVATGEVTEVNHARACARVG